MKEKIIIYTNRPKSLKILTELLDLHSHAYQVTNNNDDIINNLLKQSKCLIVDTFITNKITGMDFLMKNKEKLDSTSLFLFRTHQLTSLEEEFVSEFRINILPKPIFPLMLYKRLTQVLKL